MPAMSANVVMRIGRSRIAPASISASRSGIPCFSRAHFAKSMSRIAFFATMPMSRITPIRLMMLIVFRVIARREHHADERQRQRHQDRERIEERPELHHENEVHQHNGDAEREEDLAEHLGLLLRVAADRVTRTPGGSASPASARSTSFVTSPVAGRMC